MRSGFARRLPITLLVAACLGCGGEETEPASNENAEPVLEPVAEGPVAEEPVAEEPAQPPPAVEVAETNDVTAERLAQFRSSLGCDAPPDQDFCGAIDRFGAGTAIALPTSPESRLGRSLGVLDHRELVSFVVFLQNGVTSGEVTPDNPHEEEQLNEMLGTLRTGGEVAPSHPVAAFVAGLAVADTVVQPAAIDGGSLRVSIGNRTLYFRRTTETEIVALTIAGPHLLEIGVF